MPKSSVLSALLIGLGIVTFGAPIEAQECSPPPITANAKVFNLFSHEQEMILGDLTHQQMSGDLRFVEDPELLKYLDRLGAKLIKHLPPAGLKFRFYIVDMPEANAFNTPGGYVFVSRKLIAFTNNEDELAGVVAHELGHAIVRHAASNISELFKKILNVSQLGDRKDVAEKYNLLIERERTKSVSRGPDHESEQQQEADRIGLYVMVAAGYDANAFGSFFSRLTETKAKSGNWFGNIFGKQNPTEKRLREMIGAIGKMPAQCRDPRSASASEQFLKWQADVLSYSQPNKQPELAGLIWSKELAPKLRSDVSHFAFSPDGKYLLAQDDFAITVLQRDPLRVVFQISAPDARDASFTPDNLFIVFGTEGLRFEKWSVAGQKPIEMRELVVRRDCWEHEFSPDGKYLACVDDDAGLNVLDTQTGKKVWEKKDFYQLSYWEYLGWINALEKNTDSKYLSFFNIEYSPDSRYLVASRSNRFRFRYKWDAMTVAETENTLIALDLSTLNPVTTGGDLKKATRRPFLFLDANRILGLSPNKLEDAGIFSFPEGKRLAKFSLAAEELKLAANPRYVILKPLAKAKMGVFDVDRRIIVSAMQKQDATVWGNLIAAESVNGNVMLSEFVYNEEKEGLDLKVIGTVEIPVAAIESMEASEVSNNFQWLAVSSKTRGAIWNLVSGERKMFVRGFRGLVIADNGQVLGDFPRLEPANHSLVLLDPSSNAAEPVREIPETGARQYGSFVLLRSSLKQSEKPAPSASSPDTDSEVSLTQEVRFELRDVIRDKQIWSQDFPKDAPQFFFDEFSGRLIFYWSLGSDVAKSKLKEDTVIAARAKELGNKDDDYLIEVFDAFAGKMVGRLLLETGKGSFYIKDGFSEGNWLVLSDDNNRVLAFSLKDGELRHRFFGANASVNPSRNQMVVENYAGELTFYDLNTGESQGRLVFKNDAAFVRFSLDGKRFFVLTANQTAYVFDVDKLIVTKTPQPN